MDDRWVDSDADMGHICNPVQILVGDAGFEPASIIP
jgi:hypothetical protein